MFTVNANTLLKEIVMGKCDYGCGREAKYAFKNGKQCCSKKYRSCPYQAKEIGKLRIGKKHSDETKKKIGLKSKKRIEENGGSYFKGKKHSEETKQKQAKRMLGNIPWNKELTKETDNRILEMSQKNSDGRTANVGENNGMFGKTHSIETKNNQRQKNLKEGKWKGKNNPWFGKNRSGENSPRFLSEKERTNWEQYAQTTRMLTERTYKQCFDKINPNNHTRGLKEYHLDHIIPLWYGFLNNIAPGVLSRKENLRMIPWKNNLSRHKTKLTEVENILLQDLIKEI